MIILPGAGFGLHFLSFLIAMGATGILMSPSSSLDIVKSEISETFMLSGGVGDFLNLSFFLPSEVFSSLIFGITSAFSFSFLCFLCFLRFFFFLFSLSVESFSSLVSRLRFFDFFLCFFSFRFFSFLSRRKLSLRRLSGGVALNTRNSSARISLDDFTGSMGFFSSFSSSPDVLSGFGLKSFGMISSMISSFWGTRGGLGFSCLIFTLV